MANLSPFVGSTLWISEAVRIVFPIIANSDPWLHKSLTMHVTLGFRWESRDLPTKPLDGPYYGRNSVTIMGRSDPDGRRSHRRRSGSQLITLTTRTFGVKYTQKMLDERRKITYRVEIDKSRIIGFVPMYTNPAKRVWMIAFMLSMVAGCRPAAADPQLCPGGLPRCQLLVSRGSIHAGQAEP